MSENFQAKVLNLVKQIPKGKVTTYGEIAKKITGSAGSAITVGQALARNHHPPTIVPCHRVVKSKGYVGGYNGGNSPADVATKIKLLNDEGIEMKDGKVANFEETLFNF